MIFHDCEGARTIYFSSRAVLPCKPNKEPRTSGPHTAPTSIFPDHKAHRETRLVHTLAAFNFDPNNKRDPNDRARGRTVCASLAGPQTNRGCWNFRFYTRCRAVYFAEADPLIGRAAPSSLRQTSIGGRCHRSFSPMIRHVTFLVYYRKGVRRQLIFFQSKYRQFFNMQDDL